MIVGYARTSTIEQVAGFEAQVKELKAVGCEKIFREQVSSKVTYVATTIGQPALLIFVEFLDTSVQRRTGAVDAGTKSLDRWGRVFSDVVDRCVRVSRRAIDRRLRLVGDFRAKRGVVGSRLRAGTRVGKIGHDGLLFGASRLWMAQVGEDENGAPEGSPADHRPFAPDRLR
jgi:hypothetical protein